MRKLVHLLAALAAFGLAGPVAAQEWPSAKPITIYMGFPPGSGVDVVARMLQQPLEQSLGAKIVLDYKTGAGGNIASEVVANAKPDGYTILFGTSATHGVNPALYKRLPFDVEADFTPITPLIDVSNVLTTNADVIDAKTVQEFIAKVKGRPASTTTPPPATAPARISLSPSSSRGPSSTWCTCPTRAGPRRCNR